MSGAHLFPYRWKLADGYPARGIEKHGCKVFGTFICGGGSSMGYKLAGFEHLGGVEIDSTVAKVYERNHHPLHLFVEDLREFNKRDDLPAELYELDVLDGSPPCSTFSMAGEREAAWGKMKQFAEGQAFQTLDDLVFVYCDTIAKLRPKIYLLENVSGLVKGNARSYCKRIVDRLRSEGYTAQVFLLNSAMMGVPQARERVFIIGHRTEFALPPLRLKFNEPPILFAECIDSADTRDNLSVHEREIWKRLRPNDRTFKDVLFREYGQNSNFGQVVWQPGRVAPTVTTSGTAYNGVIPRKINDKELRLVQSFPEDYDNTGKSLTFFCGMSVPPIMTAQVANQIYLQWLRKISR